MTLKDVAKVAGVSPATVSYVLSGKKIMSQSVVDRVHEAVRVTNYKLNTAARALRTGSNRTLGLMIPDITNPYFPRLAQEIKHQARVMGYAVILMDTSYNASTEIEDLLFLQDRGIDGIIWIPSGSDFSSLEITVPLIIIDHETKGFSTIHADDFGGGRMQARYAYDKGHTSILLLSGPQSLKSAQERRHGFYEEMKSHKEVQITDCECPFSLVLPHAIEKEMLKNIMSYTCISCGNDLIAVAAMRSLVQAGVQIPKDVSIIGFDNNMMAEFVHPPLTTIAQPIEKIGSLAVSLILKIIQDPKSRIESMIVPVTLKERDSVKDLKAYAPVTT